MLEGDALEAWRARQERKRELAARVRAMDHAAFVSQLRPAKAKAPRPAKPKPKPAPKPPGRPRRLEGCAAELAARYGAGESLAQLAAAYGVHVETVRRSLTRAGVAMRPQGQPAGKPRGAGK